MWGMALLPSTTLRTLRGPGVRAEVPRQPVVRGHTGQAPRHCQEVRACLRSALAGLRMPWVTVTPSGFVP